MSRAWAQLCLYSFLLTSDKLLNLPDLHFYHPENRRWTTGDLQSSSLPNLIISFKNQLMLDWPAP